MENERPFVVGDLSEKKEQINRNKAFTYRNPLCSFVGWTMFSVYCTVTMKLDLRSFFAVPVTVNVFWLIVLFNFRIFLCFNATAM